jgi:hypothetical protein
MRMPFPHANRRRSELERPVRGDAKFPHVTVRPSSSPQRASQRNDATSSISPIIYVIGIASLLVEGNPSRPSRGQGVARNMVRMQLKSELLSLLALATYGEATT